MYRPLRLIGFLASLALALQLGAATPEQMQSGRWVRLRIDRTGLYALTEADLRSWGFTDPSRVSVFGMGGGLLPEQLRQLSPQLADPLQSVPLFAEGSTRYFYGIGPTTWYYDASTRFFSHLENPYTNYGYYLVTDAVAPREMQSLPVERSTSGAGVASEGRYTALWLHERDEYTPSESGRTLWGEDLAGQPQLTFTLPDLRATHLSTRFSFMAYPLQTEVSLEARVGGQALLREVITPAEMRQRMPAGSYKVFGLNRRSSVSATEAVDPNSPIQLNLTYSSPSVTARLDYVEANLEVPLNYSGSGQLAFTRSLSGNSTPRETYRITAPEGTHLFEVNSSGQARHWAESLSGGESALLLPRTDASGEPTRYLALRLSEAYRPSFAGVAEPMDLQQVRPGLQLVIITTEALRSESERLAAFYREQGRGVLVVGQQQLFDAFNGGTPDATALRLAMRWIYDRAGGASGAKDLQLLLVGDGAQDNRKRTPAWSTSPFRDAEFLLTYQSVNSLDLDSYTTDDYYAMLSDEVNEPLQRPDSERDLMPQRTMTIGVGRIPARTLDEARAVVDKTIAYTQAPELGPWRSRVTFVADNGDGNRHIRQSAEISDQLASQHPELSIQRIYLADYQRQSSGGQVTVPQAKQALETALQEGRLVVAYSGHGSPLAWTDEQVLTMQDVRRFQYERLPLWITATCDFANFDALQTSAGEEVLMRPRSGGIALLSTSRVVWDLPNQALAMAVLRSLFTPDELGHYRPLGSAVRDAKNSLRDRPYPLNRLNFVLLGSPLLHLCIPESRVNPTQLDGQSIPAPRLVLTPQRNIQLSGEIHTVDGTLASDFSGKLYLRLLDSETEHATIDNFGNVDTNPPFRYLAPGDALLEQEVEVSEGRYTASIRLPRDMSYSDKPLRLELYAYDQAGRTEAIGLLDQLYLGSAGNGEVQPEGTGVVIERFSLSGRPNAPLLGRVADHPTLEAQIYLPTGLNRSRAGLGHTPTLLIDEGATYTIDLSDSYQSLATSTDRGVIRYTLPTLPEGRHRLRLRLWDSDNRLTELVTEFDIYQGQPTEVAPFRLYPTVARAGERFTARLELSEGEEVRRLTAEVFDLTGKRLAQFTPSVASGTSSPVEIDLTDLTSRLPQGRYLIRLNREDTSGGSNLYTASFVLR